MKAIRYTKWSLLIVILFLGFSSCEDQEFVEDALIDYAWTGDIGMNAENGEAIFSTFEFNYNGIGNETQYYRSDGEYYDSFTFQWYWENEYDNNLVLDYGRFGLSYMDNVHISGRYLTGTFYIEDGARGFNFSLVKE